jgi:hypothetical protein
MLILVSRMAGAGLAGPPYSEEIEEFRFGVQVFLKRLV